MTLMLIAAPLPGRCEREGSRVVTGIWSNDVAGGPRRLSPQYRSLAQHYLRCPATQTNEATRFSASGAAAPAVQLFSDDERAAFAVTGRPGEARCRVIRCKPATLQAPAPRLAIISSARGALWTKNGSRRCWWWTLPAR